MQAVKDSGILDTPLDPTQFGVYLGAGEGQQDFAIFMNMISQARSNGELDVESSSRAASSGSTRSGNWSRNRICRPATWPACSMPRVPI